jgi:predicted Zn-ribbon and HTH transcriptional regulator
MESKQCPKCRGEMKKGFFYIRNSEHPIQFNYVVWVEGEKKDITKFMGSDSNASQYPVTPYKCTDCGYIEHYADPAEKWRH